MKNKNLVLFIGVGFIVTVAIWGFVGGCGTNSINLKTGSIKTDVSNSTVSGKSQLKVEQKGATGQVHSNENGSSAEGPIFDTDSATSTAAKIPAVGEVPSETASTGSQARQTYIVTQGDTLWKISKKFGVPVESIKAANNMRNDSLTVGHSLIIPGVTGPRVSNEVQVPKEVKQPKEAAKNKPVVETKPDKIVQDVKQTSKEKVETASQVQAQPVQEKLEPKPGTSIYKVRSNDNLWRIAQTYGISPEHICDLNGLPKNAQLKPGQEILVPSNE